MLSSLCGTASASRTRSALIVSSCWRTRRARPSSSSRTFRTSSALESGGSDPTRPWLSLMSFRNVLDSGLISSNGRSELSSILTGRSGGRPRVPVLKRSIENVRALRLSRSVARVSCTRCRSRSTWTRSIRPLFSRAIVWDSRPNCSSRLFWELRIRWMSCNRPM